jgi:hypothetical protein
MSLLFRYVTKVFARESAIIWKRGAEINNSPPLCGFNVFALAPE